MDEGPAASVPARGRGGRRPGGTETILLLEDEESLRLMLSEVLQSAGYQVQECGTPEAALAAAVRSPGQPIDLMLADLVMPRMSGHEVAQRIRRVHRRMKLLYMSGYSRDLLGRSGGRTGTWSSSPSPSARPRSCGGCGPCSTGRPCTRSRSGMGGPKDLPRSQTRVLVADDSRLVRTMVAGCLRDAGCLVEEAEDGAHALQCLEGATFDVVVTDLQMPRLDGFGVLEAVKEHSKDTEVIILTGSHAQDMSAAIRALRLGAHDFLTKPPTGPDEVVLTVARAAEKKRLRETNARLIRELESASLTDALTGAQNRRAFDETLKTEVERSRRYGYPLSLVILDLDHFKAVNDGYGHPAGDAVLTAFAGVARTALRVSDALYRYGGEEFAAMLPHTPLEGGMVAARRVVSATAATSFNAGTVILKMTVSAGVACLSALQASPADLLAVADAALYEAKRAGRNRACGG